MKNYVVRHKPSNSGTWVPVDYFDNVKDALAKYGELRKTYPRERVWVVDLLNEQVIADSHAK